MWCSTFIAITRHNGRGVSEFEGEWRTNNLLGRPANHPTSCFSNCPYTNRREVTKFENVESPEVRNLRLIFK
jgi:hypothetical protein